MEERTTMVTDFFGWIKKKKNSEVGMEVVRLWSITKRSSWSSAKGCRRNGEGDAYTDLGRLEKTAEM